MSMSYEEARSKLIKDITTKSQETTIEELLPLKLPYQGSIKDDMMKNRITVVHETTQNEDLDSDIEYDSVAKFYKDNNCKVAFYIKEKDPCIEMPIQDLLYDRKQGYGRNILNMTCDKHIRICFFSYKDRTELKDLKEQMLNIKKDRKQAEVNERLKFLERSMKMLNMKKLSNKHSNKYKNNEDSESNKDSD